MDVDDRLALMREVGEEIVTEDELRALLAEKPHPVAYDGFEPSGTIHIAQGVLRAINVNKMTAAGARFKMFVADWHAWANNKMGGDLDKIQTTGRYIQEIWKSTGMDLQHVKFVWASEFVTDESYWKKVMNIARDSSLDRILRTTQIMGRSEKDKLSASQILYPCMQAADIFHLGADITQLGMDQRKVNMLAREVGPKLGLWKPVVVSHHMLMGLQAPPAQFHLKGEILQASNVIRHEGFMGRAGTAAPAHSPPMDALRLFDSDLTRAESVDDALIVLDNLNHACVDALAAIGASGGAESGVEGAWAGIQAGIEKTRAYLNNIPKRQVEATIERATALKMSKSNPETAIFMTDSPIQVESKLKKAYCPEKVARENPVLEYYRYIIFERHWANAATARAGASPVTIERPDKFGGTVTYDTYAALEADYVAGKVHPADLKKTAAKYVNEILQPVREHFEKDAAARALKEQVESFKVTR